MRGKKPTRKQKEFLSKKKLDPGNWLVVQDTNKYIDIINKTSERLRRLLK